METDRQRSNGWNRVKRGALSVTRGRTAGASGLRRAVCGRGATGTQYRVARQRNRPALRPGTGMSLVRSRQAAVAPYLPEAGKTGISQKIMQFFKKLHRNSGFPDNRSTKRPASGPAGPDETGRPERRSVSFSQQTGRPPWASRDVSRPDRSETGQNGPLTAPERRNRGR